MANQVSKIQARVNNKNRISLEETNKPPVNAFWEDAREHYEKSIGAIANVEATVRDHLVEFVADSNKVSMLKDPDTFATNINVLTRDIEEHINRLEGIYKRHSDKVGGTTTPDEHMELLNIHGEYAEALEIYQANIIPTVSHILEQVGVVDELLLSMEKPNSLTDVNVISDIEVKETTESK